jgi:MFS family permease
VVVNAFVGAMVGMEPSILPAIYPAVWSLGQLFTGAWSDKVGRKRLIVAGMWIQAIGMAGIALGDSFSIFAV